MRIAILVAAFGLAACQRSDCSRDGASCNELANKPEWSLLQGYEYELRTTAHERPFIRFQNARGSDLTVLAFPRRNSRTGYVVLLENSNVAPKDKTLPDEEFVVSQAVFDAVRGNPDLTPDAARLIAEMHER